MSTTETLTIHLPASAARRLRRMAEIARRPVDEVLAETLYATLPPLLEDVPAAFQADLARLETLPSEALHEQMRAVLRPENVTRYETLQAIWAERQLTEVEQQEWEDPAHGSRSPDASQGIRRRAAQMAWRAHSHFS